MIIFLCLEAASESIRDMYLALLFQIIIALKTQTYCISNTYNTIIYNFSMSHISSVTVYRIPRMQGLNVSCGVNIIDTPGFNDT